MWSLLILITAGGLIGCVDPPSPQKHAVLPSARTIDSAGRRIMVRSFGGAGDEDSNSNCGPVPAIGCCNAQVLWWCEKGVLASINCATTSLCGWSNSSFYDCNTSGGADPSGTYAKDCRSLLGDAQLPPTDGAVPDGKWGQCGSIQEEGCCAGDTLKYCQEGQLKVISCMHNQLCGWLANGSFYDCGTNGLSDPSGRFPLHCSGPTPDASTHDPDTKEDGANPVQGDGPSNMTGCACQTDQGRGDSYLFFVLLATALLLIKR